MIVVRATARMKSDKRDEAIAVARKMQEATRSEDGNISYTFAADLEDDAVFHLFEEWKTQEDLDTHFATPHMGEFIVGLGDVLDGDMPATKYLVAEHGPL